MPWTLTASILCTLLFSAKPPDNADSVPQPGYTAAMGCVCVALVLDALVDPTYTSALHQWHSGYEMRVEVAAKLLESAVVWLLIVKAPWVRVSLFILQRARSTEHRIAPPTSERARVCNDMATVVM